MKRKFWIAASFSALFARRDGTMVSIAGQWRFGRVSTPEFGFRIGAPTSRSTGLQPVRFTQPVPDLSASAGLLPAVYRRAITPPPVVYVPPPRWGHGYCRVSWPRVITAIGSTATGHGNVRSMVATGKRSPRRSVARWPALCLNPRVTSHGGKHAYQKDLSST